MKGTLAIYVFCLGFVLHVQAGQNRQTAADSVITLKNQTDSLQYAIGSFLAQWVNKNGFAINNPVAYLTGMDHVFKNHSRLLPDSTASRMVLAYQAAHQEKISKESATALFAVIKEKPGMGMMPGGVYYEIEKSGEGIHPLKSDSVVIHIKGMTADSILFEDTYAKHKPSFSKVADLIPGVASALPLMGVGDKWKLYIPSLLAYGKEATALIPANSALIVELELLRVKHPSK
jgi:FKBP-type peptidyl-prolyl cis-trans isomerase